MSSTCPSCGARVESGQSKCDLCGTSLAASEASSAGHDGENDPLARAGAAACTVCGSRNPEGSRFCNQCGSKLTDAQSTRVMADLPGGGGAEGKTSAGGSETERESPGPDQSRDMVKRVVFTVGAGVLLMMILYGVTLLSEGETQQSSGTSQAAVAGESGAGESSSSSTASQDAAAESPEPLSGELVEEVDALKESIAAASGSSERIDLQQKLVRLYVEAERQDLAGAVQERIARSEQTAMAWADAGNLYYDWMMQQQSRAGQTQYAKKAISAYRRSLEIDPTNLDVRTDMAVAYLYDPDNPMQAIQQTRKVLEEDPDHIQANFNRGIMLLRINRVEEAVKQFERVKSLASPDAPVYERTEQVLQQIRQRQ